MTLADAFVVTILIGILLLIFYFTRKKGDHGCAGCHKNCTSCSSYGNLFEDYKKDQEKKK